ncbi:hypothetical protein HPULCUR_010339 [Helicostylum pulchrum]|uniref:Uncharacterized protein n=1 Tax=Helicostylum pulchrum TaxID=562976 RepID=A0ABP9YD25_9FUNG
MQNPSRLNNSLISSRTRSRSSSVSSANSASREDMSVDTQQSFSVLAPSISLSRVSNDSDMTAALSRSFFATGASNTWDSIKSDLKKLDAKISRFEDRFDRIESRIDRLERIESKLDIILSKLEGSSEPRELVTCQSDSTLFRPGTAMYNMLSGWIRTSLDNQKGAPENLVWDYTKPLADTNNETVTNNVIAYVGSQIENITNKLWNSIVSYREIKAKVVLVFHRQKANLAESEEKKAAKKKLNVRKGRRVTKLKHRKKVMAHSVFGSEMKTLFGNDVFNLALEQLQSDEESTDTEAGEGIEAFEKFDEFDLQIRKNAKKEKELRMKGRTKTIEIKNQYLDQAPAWSKA